MDIKAGVLLNEINNPDDLKKLNREQLHQVCDELRQYIIDVVSVYGGHFGASLGVVELSVALHMFSKHLTISWYGMWATRLTATRYLPAAETIFLQTENTTDLVAFPSAAKVNTILLVLATLQLLYLQHWVWLWHRITKVKPTGSMLPSLAMEL